MTTDANETTTPAPAAGDVIGDLVTRLSGIEPRPQANDHALQEMARELLAASGASCVEITALQEGPVTVTAGTPCEDDDTIEASLSLGSTTVGVLRLHGATAHLEEWDRIAAPTIVPHIGSLVVAHGNHGAPPPATDRDHLLTSVSHELRTPLTFISGIVTELIDGRDLPWNERRRLLDMISEQSADMARIVEDLLADGQAAADRLELTVERLDLAAEAVRVADSARIELAATATTNQIHCLGDARRVRQILRNLLTNADRYGGPHITVSAFRDLHRAYLAICDNGPPIPIEQRRHLFEDFARPDTGRRHPASVGIGLSVSRRLASLMGGSLGYEHDGRQSRFILGLPIAEM